MAFFSGLWSVLLPSAKAVEHLLPIIASNPFLAQAVDPMLEALKAGIKGSVTLEPATPDLLKEFAESKNKSIFARFPSIIAHIPGLRRLCPDWLFG